MKPKVYIETTIPSYLTAWPSRDLIRAAHQQLTREWWDSRRPDFDLFTSQLVIEEAGAGDPIAAAERLRSLEGLRVLGTTPAAERLAVELVREVPLPEKAELDALHIAIAVVNRMDFLLTWNCSHIANATHRRGIDAICEARGESPIIICTPPELLKGSTDD